MRKKIWLLVWFFTHRCSKKRKREKLAVLAALGLVRLWRKEPKFPGQSCPLTKCVGIGREVWPVFFMHCTSPNTDVVHHPGALRVLRKHVNNVMTKPCTEIA